MDGDGERFVDSCVKGIQEVDTLVWIVFGKDGHGSRILRNVFVQAALNVMCGTLREREKQPLVLDML